MGGGGQANSGQASQSFQGGQAASAQDMALSQQNAAEQKLIFDKLFGSGGKPGTLTSFLDPKNINQKGLNPAYQTQFNEASNQIAKGYANERGQLARSFANNGATSNSTPTGFQADQMNKLSRGEADTRGATYTGLKGAQYQDALNNFWNANNVATGQAAGARSGALQGSGQSGSVQDQLYGTAGQYHQGQMGNVLGSAIGAGGAMGSAGITAAAQQCPASGSKILMGDGGVKNVEDLRKGDFVRAIDGMIDELIDDPAPSKPQDVVKVMTREFSSTLSMTHTLARPQGGYLYAGRAVGQTVATLRGAQGVLSIEAVTQKEVCWHLFLNRSHTFNCDGLWSLE